MQQRIREAPVIELRSVAARVCQRVTHGRRVAGEDTVQVAERPVGALAQGNPATRPTRKAHA